jgi:hypothetical protein
LFLSKSLKPVSHVPHQRVSLSKIKTSLQTVATRYE